MHETVCNECIPIARIGTADEIAQPIAFLADDATSSYMLGQTMVVDGGLTLDLAVLRAMQKVVTQEMSLHVLDA